MSQQKQIKKTVTEEESRDLAADDAEVAAAQSNQTDLTHTDEFLDEIDGLLEENAAAFLASYRQKSGQ